MQNQIQLKSAAIGAIVGVAAVLSIGAATPSTTPGRYQLIANDHGNVWKIDTTTGEVWSSYAQGFRWSKLPEPEN